MKKYLFILFSLTLFSNISHAGDNNPDVNPLDLEFQRLAVRRFIFSNNLILNEFIPYEIVSFKSMHPAFSVSENNTPAPDKNFRPQIKKGKLVFNKNAGKGQKTLTNYSKTDINDRVSQTRTKTVRTCFFSDSV